MKKQLILFLMLTTWVRLSTAQDIGENAYAGDYSSQFNKNAKNSSKTWRLSQVHLSAIANGSWYNDIDMDYMKAYAQNNNLFDLDLSDMREILYQDVSAGGVSLKFELENLKATHPQSLRIGVEYYGGKEAMITYNGESINSETGFNDYEYYTYCIVQDEIALRADYIWKLKPNDHWINLYAGVGGNISTSVNNELLLLSNNDTEIQTAKASQFYRAHGLAGLEMKLISRVKLNLEGNFGYGIERISSEKTYTYKNVALNAGLSFRL